MTASPPGNMRPAELTPVERRALAASPFDALYAPTERIRTIVVDNFPALGKLAALRFIEWAQAHPGGVISLPTGKTPEHFIGWVRRLLADWDAPATRAELEADGIDPAVRPDMRSLHFVQIDEFYPIDPRQHNSFYSYVNRFYVDGFGLDPARALLINCAEIGIEDGADLADCWPRGEVDLTLRYRAAGNALERRRKELLSRVDQWCQSYEDRIRALGGIGFFLGGIGPDGHVGFNVRGSDHHSTTRLTHTNYETQAAAATDLGGIEIARKRLVITIGLGTITFNPDCAAVIIAAGEAKAPVVADAVQRDPDVLYPATALHRLPNARFYITAGAAGLLRERQYAVIVKSQPVTDAQAEPAVIDLAVRTGKPIDQLTDDDFAADRIAAAVLERRPEGRAALAARVRDGLIGKIERGTRVLTDTTFFHTEPHHDDLMLAYLPSIVRHTRVPSNKHYFVSMTSGFTAVTNHFMADQLDHLRRFLGTPDFADMMERGYFDPDNVVGRNRDIWQYLDGVAAGRPLWKSEGIARRLLRNLIAVYGETDSERIAARVAELDGYFRTQYPGGKDPEPIQRLKGMCREWEVECLWGYLGWTHPHTLHLRLGFYTGDIFTEEPEEERDVLPILREMERVAPDVVTVALDPEASGPDTHYKVLQAVTGALRDYEQKSGRSDIRVWGYRNVWYRFHPAEADMFVPISLNMFAIMQDAFINTFNSQRDASFPSHEHDGPFSELAQRIQVEQYQALKTCLGRTWFYEHPSAMIRATRGLVFLREMTLPELYRHSRELKHAAENR